MKKISKNIYVFVFAMMVSLHASSQTSQVFNHLDLSLTAGTTGIGLDVASPVGDYVRLRAGFSIMPRIHKDMRFEIQVGDDAATSEQKFNTLSGYLKDFMGQEVDDHVTMVGRPTYSNFNLLVDVFPFKKNKHWHFTAGFYLGSDKIADCINDMSVSPSLTCVNIYNKIYNDFNQIEVGKCTELNILGRTIVIDLADPDFPHMEIGDEWIDLDPNNLDQSLPIRMRDRMRNCGDMKIHVGDFKDGTPYYMYPDDNCTVSANGYANKFKPYLGFGYGGRLLKNNDKYFISFDCGAMFWGGKPDIITHDGVNITKDLINIRGSVKDYVDLISAFKVMPVLNLRISRRIF